MIFTNSDVFNTGLNGKPKARAQKVVVRCVSTVHASKNAGKATFLVVAFCGGPSVDHGLSPNSYSVAPRFTHALHYVNPLIIVGDKGGGIQGRETFLATSLYGVVTYSDSKKRSSVT